MIKITVSGFKQQVAEVETQNQALLFLTNLKQEHSDFLRPLINGIDYNVGKRNSAVKVVKVIENESYYKEIRSLAKKHPLKVKIEEFDDDMTGLI